MENEIKHLRLTDPQYQLIRSRIQFPHKKDPEKFLYYYKVWSITNENIHLVEDIHKRGADYHLDHIIPIHIGYKYHLCPTILGSAANLRMLERRKNLSKGCSITDDTLKVLSDFGIDLSQMEPRKIIKYTPDGNSHRTVTQSDLSTDNPSSLLYYLPSNKKRIL